jgi:hypothetical protein
MKKWILFLILYGLILPALLAQATAPLPPNAASNCDLVIRSYEQLGTALELDIFASEAGLIPFDVVLEQGTRQWRWDSLPHQSHRRFRIEGIATTGTATLRLESLGKPGCYATTSVTLTDPAATRCELAVLNHTQTESTLRLSLKVPDGPGTPLHLLMTQGEQQWSWLQSTPGSAGVLDLDDLPTTGHVYLTLTPTDRPACAITYPVTIRPHRPGTALKTVGLNNHSGRLIVMNTTGWGFDWQDETGVAESFRRQLAAFNSQVHQGEAFQAVDALRLLVRWYDYEPREGQYRDEALLAAVRWCRAHNLKFALCFWPLRQQNDGLLPPSDWTTGMLGTVFSLEGRQYQPALYSATGREKLQRTLRHLASVLAPHAADVVYLSMAYGDTEEYFSPGIVRQNPWGWTELTGYSAANRTAWSDYCRTHGLGEVPPPVPDPGRMPWISGQVWTGSPVGRHWYLFMSQGLLEFWANFREAVREGAGGTLNVAGYYADLAGEQSAWYMSYDLLGIFEGCDVIYTTEGGSQPELIRKLMATDFNRGTFPRAQAAIEFDPNDLSFDNGQTADMPLNPASLRDYGGSFFRRGGSLIHLAMSFSDHQIRDLAPALHYLRSEFIEKAPSPLPQPAALLTGRIRQFRGDQYFELWKRAGGSLAKPVPIRQEPLSR